MVLTALTLFVLLGAAAIAVDLAAMRADRSTDQKITDTAASSAALTLAETGSGQEACEAALAYIAINSAEIPTLNDAGCATAFSGTCDPAVAESHTITSGRFTITIVYPVPDSHALMTSGALGATAQPLVDEDGEPCQRIGVEISAVHDGVFSQLLGFDQGTTTVHTVAKSGSGGGTSVPINLLVLDRTGCQAVKVEGNGGIIVTSIVNDTGTGLLPGLLASDSDGSAGCSTNGVIYVNGSNAVMRADGPAGCVNQTGTSTVGGFTSGHGCGLIQTIAPGTPGCNEPACTPGSGGANPPNPVPTALAERLTRQPVDHRYNCWSDYTSPPAGTSWAVDPLTAGNGQNIEGCTNGTADHIYDLINTVGQNGSAGYTDWNGTYGHSCNIPSSSPPITVGPNVRIDCPTFTVRATVNITGNVIFDGDVNVTGGTGSLNILNTAGSPGWAFFRNGTLSKSGQASIAIDYTAVYMSKTSTITMAGGTGSLRWIAPTSGNFDDLALWSDSPSLHAWAGQANLTMEGVFFMPLATAEYSGTGGQNQTEAQWIAHRLNARGQGTLVVAPAFGRAVNFPLVQVSLIR